MATDNWWQIIRRCPATGRARAWQHKVNLRIVRHCGHPRWRARPFYVDGLLKELGTFRLLKDAKAAAINHVEFG